MEDITLISIKDSDAVVAMKLCNESGAKSISQVKYFNKLKDIYSIKIKENYQNYTVGVMNMSQLEKQICKHGLTDTFDAIYANSANGDVAKNLYKHIISDNNILLAITCVRKNDGANTPGVDGVIMDDYLKTPIDELVSNLKKRMGDYQPHAVKRIWVEKLYGGMRPLGIPTIEDRIIQQAFKQVLEPWCEARFYPHSYGFRPLRGAHHAFSRVVTLINIAQTYYTVDIDLEDFFNNVSHKKLNKALWNIGIRDKTVLKMIDKMLTAEVVDEGRCDKGLPQGGVLSPLLSNILLNQLDWWVSSQWESLPYGSKRYVHTKTYKGNTNLKTGYIVRYADDFKILCRTYKDAKRWYHAVTQWLNEFLELPINEDKSGITNLKRTSTDFLGFSIKVREKGGTRSGWVAETHISQANQRRIQEMLRQKIKDIQYNSYSTKMSIKYNLAVMGIKRYYQYATHVYIDLDRIAQSTFRTMKVRLRDRAKISTFQNQSSAYKKQQMGVRKHTKVYMISGAPLHIIQAVHHKNPMNFSQNKTIYSKKGRELNSKSEDLPVEWIRELVNKSRYTKESVIFIEHRMSHYIADKGRCFVTGLLLSPDELHCHHKLPRKLGGGDDYGNLCIVHNTVHKLIHGVDNEKIINWLRDLQITHSQLQKLNQLRKRAGNLPIDISLLEQI